MHLQLNYYDVGLFHIFMTLNHFLICLIILLTILCQIYLYSIYLQELMYGLSKTALYFCFIINKQNVIIPMYYFIMFIIKNDILFVVLFHSLQSN